MPTIRKKGEKEMSGRAVKPRRVGRRYRSARKKALGTVAESESPDWSYASAANFLQGLRSRVCCYGCDVCADDDFVEDQLAAASYITGLSPQNLRGHMVGAHE